MDALQQVNKSAIYEKLDKVIRLCIMIGDTPQLIYNCNDLIDSLSQSKERDKRIINEYKENTYLRQISINGVMRACRFLDIIGVEKYLTNGKVYSYKHACEYFNVTPINKEHAIWQSELVAMQTKATDGLYDTKMVLKFLYGKRKSIRGLSKLCSIADILAEIPDDDESVNMEKLVWLKKSMSK